MRRTVIQTLSQKAMSMNRVQSIIWMMTIAHILSEERQHVERSFSVLYAAISVEALVASGGHDPEPAGSAFSRLWQLERSTMVSTSVEVSSTSPWFQGSLHCLVQLPSSCSQSRSSLTFSHTLRSKPNWSFSNSTSFNISEL